MVTTEEFKHSQPFGNSDPAFTATGRGELTAATPAMTPLMLDASSGKLTVWDGTSAGGAAGILAISADQSSSQLTFYKSGTFRYEDVQWPSGAASEVKKRNAFAGSSISIV